MARVGIFSWLRLCGVVGLRWGADVSRLCVCLCWFPACVYQPTIASLCNSNFHVFDFVGQHGRIGAVVMIADPTTASYLQRGLRRG